MKAKMASKCVSKVLSHSEVADLTSPSVDGGGIVLRETTPIRIEAFPRWKKKKGDKWIQTMAGE